MTEDKDFVATREDVIDTVLAPIRARLIDDYRIIEYLEKQIEKMKCCENCKHHRWTYGDLDCGLKYSCYDTNYDKWELAEW